MDGVNEFLISVKPGSSGFPGARSPAWTGLGTGAGLGMGLQILHPGSVHVCVCVCVWVCVCGCVGGCVGVGIKIRLSPF